MTVFEELVRAISDQEVMSPTIANAEIAAHAERFARDLPARDQLTDLVSYLREQALMSERDIVDAVVSAMTTHAEEPARQPRTLLTDEPPTVLQELALARIVAAYKANLVALTYHAGTAFMMAGYVEFSLTREGKPILNGGIDPNGRVST